MLQICFLLFLVPIGLVGQLLYNSDKSKQVPGETGCYEDVCPEVEPATHHLRNIHYN